MPPSFTNTLLHQSFTNTLLHQNRGSKHNKDCTCEFESWGGLKQANPACPVQGHRYSLCLHVSLWPSTPSLYASPAQGQRGRGVDDHYIYVP
jgi:hypothetical protein